MSGIGEEFAARAGDGHRHRFIEAALGIVDTQHIAELTAASCGHDPGGLVVNIDRDDSHRLVGPGDIVLVYAHLCPTDECRIIGGRIETDWLPFPKDALYGHGRHVEQWLGVQPVELDLNIHGTQIEICLPLLVDGTCIRRDAKHALVRDLATFIDDLAINGNDERDGRPVTGPRPFRVLTDPQPANGAVVQHLSPHRGRTGHTATIALEVDQRWQFVPLVYGGTVSRHDHWSSANRSLHGRASDDTGVLPQG